jgi:hypothetical protein
MQLIAVRQRTCLQETFSEEPESPFYTRTRDLWQTPYISDRDAIYEPGDTEARENAYRSAEGERVCPLDISHA